MSFLKITNLELRLFYFGVVCCLLARGSALVSLTFNVDDLAYWPLPFNYDTVSAIAFRDGRFFGPLLAALQDALGVNAPRSFMLSASVLMLCQVVVAVLICRMWRLSDNFVLSAIVVGFVVLHPFQADSSTWKIAQLSGGIPFVMTFSALHYCNFGRKSFLAAVVLIVLALGIHQIPLQMAAAALVLMVPITLLRDRFDFTEWAVASMALFLGAVVYVVVAKIVISNTGHTLSLRREQIILLSDPALVWSRTKELFDLFIFRDHLTGWLTRVLSGVLAFSCCLRITLRGDLTFSNRVLLMFAFSSGLGIAFLCAVALTVVAYSWMPSYRNLQSIGLLWAAVGVSSYMVSDRIWRIVVGICIFMIYFGFIASNNQILSDQQRTNRRDVAMINRIAADVDALDNSSMINRIVFVGTNSSSLAGILTAADYSKGTNSYGVTLSAFSVFWPHYVRYLYNEITGRQFGPVTEEENNAANIACLIEGKWPDRGSVSGKRGMAVVCLGPPAINELSRFDLPNASQ